MVGTNTLSMAEEKHALHKNLQANFKANTCSASQAGKILQF